MLYFKNIINVFVFRTTLIILAFCLTSVTNPSTLKITVIPLGNVEANNVELVHHELKKYYKAHVSIKTVKFNLNRFVIQDKAGMVSANSLIESLDSLANAENSKILAVTDRSITLGKGGFKIRGLAFLNGNSGVVSTSRILDESNSNAQFKDLLSKAALHEVGHMIGLEHCESGYKCFMVSSLPNPDAFFQSPKDICLECKKVAHKFLK